MAPKKKVKQPTQPTAARQETQPTVTATKEVSAQTSKPIAKQTPSKPVVVEPTKTVESVADKKLGEQELQKKPNTLIKLNQDEAKKKILSLQNTVKTDKELRELRAFKFGGKQTTISIDDAANLIADRARKFGGNVPMSGNQKKMRLEKFGGTDNEQENELRRKRKQKFGKGHKVQSVFPDLPALTEEEKAALQARKLKFSTNPVEAPNLNKQLKLD